MKRERANNQIFHKNLKSMQLFKCPIQNPSILQISSSYALVIAVALFMSWQMWYYGVQISGFRKKIFNLQFMRKNWAQVHRDSIGEEIQLGGLPDTGSGIYSHQLAYKDWYQFNVMQRLHMNYVEGINLAQVSMLAAGVFRPKQAAIVGLLFIVGKFSFSSGYRSKMGALSKRRIFGVALCYFASATNTIIFLYYLLRNVIM